FGHGPESKALRAALTARSTSALSPSATWQMVSPVAGLRVGKDFPEALSTHLPPMNIGWSLTCGGLAVRDRGEVAVVIVGSSWGTGRTGSPRERGRRDGAILVAGRGPRKGLVVHALRECTTNNLATARSPAHNRLNAARRPALRSDERIDSC